MTIRRAAGPFTFALLCAVFAANAKDSSCGKNHYILNYPCAPEWAPANAGLDERDVRVVTVDPNVSSTLYAGGRAGLFRSLDGGARWDPLAPIFGRWYLVQTLALGNVDGYATGMVTSVAIDPRDTRVLHVGTQATGGWWTQPRMFKSVDGGATWANSSVALHGFDDVLSLLMDPRDPSTLYMTNWDDMSGTLSPFTKTVDGGATWSYSIDPQLDVLGMDPHDSRTLYGGTSTRGVLKSVDAGASWQSTGLMGYGVSALALDDADPPAIYAALYGHGEPPHGQAVFRGVQKSVDGGDHWTPAAEGLGALIGQQAMVTALLAVPGDAQTVYLATSGAGVWRSFDGGATWAAVNAGLESLVVRSLAYAPGTPAALYAGTSAGVFRLPLVYSRLGQRSHRTAR